jgi:hypothetical protein
MRDKKSLRGEVCHFKKKADWSDEAVRHVKVSSLYRSHMVIVLSKGPNTPAGWARIATVCTRYNLFMNVASKLPQTFISDLFLPIYPTRKFCKNGVQLRLCSIFESESILPLRSYLRMDGIEEVPIDVLYEINRRDGLPLIPQEKPFCTMHNLLKKSRLLI